MKSCKDWLCTLLANPFVKRLAISKSLGVLIGVLGFIFLHFLWADVPELLPWGILFWYATLGGIVGLMGVMTQHPALPSFKFSACFRGALIGGWMNFVLVFFAYDGMEKILRTADILGMHSPWWFIIEGIIIGIFIDFVATQYAGEGKTITKDLV